MERSSTPLDSLTSLPPPRPQANHASTGEVARIVGTPTSIELRAQYTLDPGDEVTWTYDRDADYVDLFERYAFFDATSVSRATTKR